MSGGIAQTMWPTFNTIKISRLQALIQETATEENKPTEVAQRGFMLPS